MTVFEEMREGLKKAVIDPIVKAIVITGADGIFSAGNQCLTLSHYLWNPATD